jgi:hypothetical protein
LLEGSRALDNAINRGAAAVKHIKSPVAGDVRLARTRYHRASALEYKKNHNSGRISGIMKVN